MNRNSKSIPVVKHLSLFAVSLLMIAGASNAHATAYNVSARFADGGIQHETLFNGSFDWDGATLSNFTGSLTQSMWAWNGSTYVNGMNAGTTLANLQSQGYGQAPVLNLNYQLDGATADGNGNIKATVFLKNSTDVFNGGGYDLGDKYKYGGTLPTADGNTANRNAYFTLFFNALSPQSTALTVSKIVYGDCTPMGLMGPMMTGNVCMTGHSDTETGYFGSMGGKPTMLNISEVPVPAAAWLFGGALMSLFGANRRKSVLPV